MFVGLLIKFTLLILDMINGGNHSCENKLFHYDKNMTNTMKWKEEYLNGCLITNIYIQQL